MSTSKPQSWLVILIVGWMTSMGCKPASEPEFPYETQPLEQITTNSATVKEVQKVAGIHATEETPTFTSSTSSVDSVAGIDEEASPEANDTAIEEVGCDTEAALSATEPITSFHGARGSLLRAEDGAGTHEYEFLLTGFFRYQLEKDGAKQVIRSGTYQLEDEALHLQYTETRMGNVAAGDSGGFQIVRGKSVTLPVVLPGDGSLHLGKMRFLSSE